ncbi:hypothetical protein ACIRSS_36585 [Amycolatopsis sp. NPDC101161]|uniref:hypothetical protein n=1 Tax=Amycolatopsis sp. NPDC101161 TaxID=3363940 RepID=UPI00381C17E9
MTARPEPVGDSPHPHGVVGYTLDDDDRTRNAIRLVRWAVLGLAIVAAAVVAVALVSPVAAAGLLVGGSTATGAASAWRHRRKGKR